MSEKWIVTFEIETEDGDPSEWNWENLYIGEENIYIVKTELKEEASK